MSDLISRNQVLDLLYKIFDKYKMSTDKNTSIGKSFGTDVFEEIRNLPTTYDIDSVIDELEENSFELGNDSIPISYVRLIRAIEIVEQGGVGKVVE